MNNILNNILTQVVAVETDLVSLFRNNPSEDLTDEYTPYDLFLF